MKRACVGISATQRWKSGEDFFMILIVRGPVVITRITLLT